MSRELDPTGKEITVFTNFKFKDYEGIEEEDIMFPSFKELIRKELTRINKEIEAPRKEIG